MNIQKMIVQHIFNKETEEKLIKALNDNINIPIIGEKTEEKIIRALWNTVEEVLTKIILK
tara:strand:+ start:214 stop:393 length:180 start_codon:yes stop_codon:yes gene_type:complete